MTIEQLHSFRHWHITHLQGHRIEMTVCNLVLGAWLTGWTMLLPLAVLGTWELLPLSLLLVLLPRSYYHLRAHLHHRGWLRCDWLAAVSPDADALRRRRPPRAR